MRLAHPAAAPHNQSMNTLPDHQPKTILLVGASRGLGAAMAGEFVEKGWHVIGTVRESGRTELHDLADAHAEQVNRRAARHHRAR